MAMLEIDGVGKVEVGSDFLTLSPDRQAAEVANIAASIKTTKPNVAQQPEGQPVTLTDTPQTPPEKPTDIVTRGAILPAGRTREGNLVPAVPGFAEPVINTIRDILAGNREIGQLSGKEAFDLGLLLAGGAPRVGAMTAKEATSVAEAAAARAKPAGESPAAVPPSVAPVAAPAESAAPVTAAESTLARPAIEATPTTAAELKTASQSFYKKLDDSNVVISQPAYANMANDVYQTVVTKGLDPTLTPNSMAALKRITELADQPVTFQSLDLMRQIASDAQGAAAPSDRRVAGLIVDKLDDFFAKLTSKEVTGGDPKTVADAVLKARDLWSKASKLDQVARLVDRAEISAPNFSASGAENALRTEFRHLAKNDGAMRKFTPEEREAIKTVAKGTALGNTARNLGKLAPTGVVSAFTSGGIGAAAGSLVGMPALGAVAAGTIGYSARHLATVLTRRNIEALEKAILQGGDSPMAQSALRRSRELLVKLQGSAGVGAEQTANQRRKN